jgi:hypothetical protein
MAAPGADASAVRAPPRRMALAPQRALFLIAFMMIII